MTDSISFLLSAPSETVLGTGVTARYDAVDAARAALAGGAPAVAGLLPFDTAGPAALFTPSEMSFDGKSSALWRGDPSTSSGSMGSAGNGSGAGIGSGAGNEVVRCAVTPPEVHRRRVVAALDAIAAGRVEKVVLARTLELTYRAPLDPARLAANFAAGAGTATVFASHGADGRWLIGASPELLVRKQGRIVTCHPYAGSAPRPGPRRLSGSGARFSPAPGPGRGSDRRCSPAPPKDAPSRR